MFNGHYIAKCVTIIDIRKIISIVTTNNAMTGGVLTLTRITLTTADKSPFCELSYL